MKRVFVGRIWVSLHETIFSTAWRQPLLVFTESWELWVVIFGSGNNFLTFFLFDLRREYRNNQIWGAAPINLPILFAAWFLGPPNSSYVARDKNQLPTTVKVCKTVKKIWMNKNAIIDIFLSMGVFWWRRDLDDKNTNAVQRRLFFLRRKLLYCVKK